MGSELRDTIPGHQCPEYDEDDDDDEHLIQVSGSPSVSNGELVISLIGQCKCGWSARNTIR